MQINQVDKSARPSFLSETEPVGTDVVITVAAVPDEFWVLDWISWSYSAAGAGRLRVTIGGATVLDMDVVDAGPGLWSPELPLYTGEKNQEMVVTLFGVSGSVGKMSVRYR